MSRKKSPLRKKALKLFIESGRKLTPKEIAECIGVSSALIRKWKHEEDWDEQPDKRPRGGQPGNKNAVGNSGGQGGPPENDHALTHGAYSRFLPRNEKFQELLSQVRNADPLDMLWNTVEIAYAKLIWSQDIMFVEDRDDHTKEIKSESPGKFGDAVSWQISFAQEKQSADISAFTKISREFRSAMRQFIMMAPEHDERRLKLEKMQATIDRIKAQTEKLTSKDAPKPNKLENLL